MDSATAHGKPEAKTESVEDLVHRVLTGRARIPEFQRGLRWKSTHVVDLFDSIYRGFPIGSLLLWKRPAKAEVIHLGPLKISAPELAKAWWVVDGQQRLVALAAGLSPLASELPDPKYSVFFNPQDQTFHSPPKEQLPDLWVPAYELLDGARLSEWVFTWPHGQDKDLRRIVFEAGKRIREYQIPLYIIETDDPEPLKEIFYRTNNSGVHLKWEEVHDALFGSASSSPSTLEDLSEELQSLGMGSLQKSRLMACLIAFRGGDTTQALKDLHRRDPALLKDAVRESLPVLRRVFSFLRQDAAIVHLRLLPRSHQLEILTRFFALHPEPASRSRILLSRWLWRSFFAPPKIAEATFRRRGISAIGDDEETSVQRILAISGSRPEAAFKLPASFDARQAGSRIALVALARLKPLSLESGTAMDIPAGIDTYGTAAFAHLVPRSALKENPALYSHPANRLIHPPTDLLALVKSEVSRNGTDTPLLQSHALNAETAAALLAGNWLEAIELRKLGLAEEVQRLEKTLAAWTHSDRPSMDFLLKSLEIAG